MAEQAAFPVDPFLPPRVVLDELEIFQLPRKRVARECLGLRKRLAIGTDPASREIESDRGPPILCECAGELRKEGPMRESLESVTDEDRSERGFRDIHLTTDGKPIATGNLESLGLNHARARHPSTSPPMSAQPINPRAIDVTFS